MTTCVWLVYILRHSTVFSCAEPVLGSCAALPMCHPPPLLKLVLPSAGFVTCAHTHKHSINFERKTVPNTHTHTHTHTEKIKLGSAELSAPEKVGDETTNLFLPLDKIPTWHPLDFANDFESAEQVAFIKRQFSGHLSGQSSSWRNLALCLTIEPFFPNLN